MERGSPRRTGGRTGSGRECREVHPGSQIKEMVHPMPAPRSCWQLTPCFFVRRPLSPSPILPKRASENPLAKKKPASERGAGLGCWAGWTFTLPPPLLPTPETVLIGNGFRIANSQGGGAHWWAGGVRAFMASPPSQPATRPRARASGACRSRQPAGDAQPLQQHQLGSHHWCVQLGVVRKPNLEARSS